jgi:UPF0755 protein
MPFSSPDVIASDTQTPKRSSLRKALLVLLVIVLVAAATLWYAILTLNRPLPTFPINEPIVIPEGTTVRQITEIMREQNAVKSADLLYYALMLYHDPASIKASTYIFTEPLTTKEVARRLSKGDFTSNLVRFTHTEGERATSIAARAEALLPSFDAQKFIVAAEPLEGRLFPETYFVPATYTDEDLLRLMLEMFDTTVAPLQDKISSSSLSLDEILVLASIIEREANTSESQRMISGILQNRLAIDMPLQADASIEYILDKPLAELTPDDLKIDSPYNTYLNTGLPPTPIGNPGLEAITAVLEPTVSDYYYYITDAEGTFHYAETYSAHQINIERYLR